MEYWWGGRRRPLGFINARPPRLFFFFRCYIRVACSHQTNCCRVHLEAAWGERSHTRFDWHVLTSPNEPPKKKRKLHPDSHTVNQAGLKVPVVHFQVLFRLLSHLALSFFFSPTLSVSFFSLPPLDQCPLCHQEMYKPSLSTPPRCVSPGAPRALSLSMESTRDIRWARRRSVSWCTLVVGGRPARSRYRSHSDFSSDGMCFSVVFKHVSSFLCHFWLRGRS